MSVNKKEFNGIKLLYMCDTHNRFNNPIYRKGDFKADITAKHLDIAKIVEDEGVDALLHGGDMYDTPSVKESTWIHFAQTYMRMNIPIYAIPGNHDMEGHNPITLPSTPIYYMHQLGVINLIQKENMNDPIIIKKNGISVQITGRGFHPAMDYPSHKEDDYVLKTKKADYAVHMIHGNLLNKPIHELAHYTLVDEVKDTVADVTLGAHYHKGFPLTVVEDEGMKKYFYNPGATVRKTRAELKSMPKVCIIYIDEEGIRIEDVYLPSAKRPNEVLDIESIERKMHDEQELQNLIEDFRKRTSQTKTVSIQEMLISISEQQNVSEDVKDIAMSFIMNAKETLGGDKK